MRSAKKNPPSYQVDEFSHASFIDFKKLALTLGNKNFNINTDREKFAFSDIKVFKISRENPFVFFYKTSYADEEFKTVDTSQTPSSRRLRNSAQMEQQLQVLDTWDEAPAYKTPPGIPPNKLDDLMSLVNGN